MRNVGEALLGSFQLPTNLVCICLWGLFNCFILLLLVFLGRNRGKESGEMCLAVGWRMAEISKCME